MRAVWIPKHGDASVLEVRETPDPEPGPGQVRIRTEFCGLNFAEISARQGLYPDAPKPPCVVGYEGSGVIDAVGDGVDAGSAVPTPYTMALGSDFGTVLDECRAMSFVCLASIQIRVFS